MPMGQPDRVFPKINLEPLRNQIHQVLEKTEPVMWEHFYAELNQDLVAIFVKAAENDSRVKKQSDVVGMDSTGAPQIIVPPGHDVRGGVERVDGGMFRDELDEY